MSYSFGVRKPTKADALREVSKRFDEIIETQPIHELDAAMVERYIERNLCLVGEPSEGGEIAISCSGYVSWKETEGDVEVTTVSSSVVVSAS